MGHDLVNDVHLHGLRRPPFLRNGFKCYFGSFQIVCMSWGVFPLWLSFATLETDWLTQAAWSTFHLHKRRKAWLTQSIKTSRQCWQVLNSFTTCQRSVARPALSARSLHGFRPIIVISLPRASLYPQVILPPWSLSGRAETKRRHLYYGTLSPCGRPPSRAGGGRQDEPTTCPLFPHLSGFFFSFFRVLARGKGFRHHGASRSVIPIPPPPLLFCSSHTSVLQVQSGRGQESAVIPLAGREMLAPPPCPCTGRPGSLDFPV